MESKRTDKFASAVSGIIHSPVEFALKGKDFPVCAAYRIEKNKAPEYLWAFVKKGGKYKLLPSDSLDAGGMSVEVYSGFIPAEELSGDALSYAIGEEGFFADISDFYVTELVDPATLPPQPPLILTEIFARPKGRAIGTYFEVSNPSTEKVDLYDYEFLLFEKKDKAEGEPTLRLPMSEAPGKDLLEPGKYAAIWWIGPNHTDKKGRVWETPHAFIRDFDSDLTNKYNQYTEDEIRVVPVHTYETDEKTGEKKLVDLVTKIPVKNNKVYLCIVRRGKGAETEVSHAVYNTIFAFWDTPVKRSSYWRTDVRKPDTGINITHYAMATPGLPSRYQGYPEPDAATPVIVPLTPCGKIYISDGSVDVSFAVIPGESGRRIAGAAVHVKTACDEEKVFEAYEQEDGLWHATIPAAFVASRNEILYYLTASDGTRSVSTAADALRVPVFDNEGPKIITIIPSEKYAFDGRDVCKVRATWYDINGTDLSKCALFIDDKDYTAAAEWSPASVKLGADLETGVHKLKLVLCDCLGNRSEKKVRFSVSDMQTLNAYVGEVHAHTAESDGSGFPRDAYEYARDTGKVDYFSSTEHSHYIDDDKFQDSLLVADEFDDPGKFAALHGWEMTWNGSCGYWGHLNVINARECINDIRVNGLPEIWKWLGERPEALGMFNHPGYPWGNFDEFSCRTDEADAVMSLSEIKSPIYDFEYMHMLAKGWHTSPVSNEDNHKPNWTTGTPMTGVALAPALTRQNIVDAFKANRTYATSDRTLKIFYKINGEWLGSRIQCPAKLNFDIEISTEEKSGIGKLEIVAEDNIVVAAKDLRGIRSISWKPVMNPEFDYYYLRITGKNAYTITAPVWIENRPVPAITAMQYAASYNTTDSAAVTVTVENHTDAALEDVRVSFILSGQEGFRLTDAEPFRTVCCGKMKKGSALNVSALIPEIAELRRLTALVTSGKTGARLRSTSFIMLNPVRIAAIMPDSSDLTRDGRDIANPFPYVTLYNASVLDYSLDGGALRAWTTTGKQPFEDRILPTDGIVIPARSAMVFWDRSSCPELTVADFNERYGTSLEEGVNIIASNIHFTTDDADGHRIDFKQGEEIISRAHWNYAYEHDGCEHEDVEHKYVYVPNMSGTVTPAGFGKPVPGVLDEAQAGKQRTVLPGRRDKKRAKTAEKKDKKAEARRENAILSKKEGAAAAAGAAAVGAAIAAGIASLLKKK